MEDLHSKLLQTRKEIYLRLKETAVGYDVQHSAELEDYYNAQETYEKKDFEVVSPEIFPRKGPEKVSNNLFRRLPHIRPKLKKL